MFLFLLLGKVAADHGQGGRLLVGVHALGPLGLLEQLLRVRHGAGPVLHEHVAPIELPVADVVELLPVVLRCFGLFVPDKSRWDLSSHHVVTALNQEIKFNYIEIIL